MPKNESPMKGPRIDQTGPPKPLTVEEVPRGMDLINHVAQCLAIGCDPHDVRKQLMTFGFTETSAAKYVADTEDWMKKNPMAGTRLESTTSKSRFNATMAMGAAICLTGIIATVATFFVASKIGRGGYVVAWGAILFGAVQFFKGAAQAG